MFGTPPAAWWTARACVIWRFGRTHRAAPSLPFFRPCSRHHVHRLQFQRIRSDPAHPPHRHRPCACLSGRGAAPELPCRCRRTGADAICGQPPDPGAGRRGGSAPVSAPHPCRGADQRRCPAAARLDAGGGAHRHRRAQRAPERRAQKRVHHHLGQLCCHVADPAAGGLPAPAPGHRHPHRHHRQPGGSGDHRRGPGHPLQPAHGRAARHDRAVWRATGRGRQPLAAAIGHRPAPATGSGGLEPDRSHRRRPASAPAVAQLAPLAA